MAVAITPTPASGSITHAKDVVTFAIEGTEPNDVSEFSTTIYPTEPEHRFVLRMTVNGATVGQSQVFGTTPDGKFEFNGYIFPIAGTYTVRVYDVTDPANEIALEDEASIVVA